MASPCVVQFCTNIGNHRFPKDETRKAEWIRAIKHVKPGLTIRHNSFLCSAHFRPTDFAITLTHLKRVHPPKVLKRKSIPSVFPWNQAQQLKQESQASSSSSLIFDSSKVQATYSRAPLTAFVEMPPVLATDIEVDNVDPLWLEHEIDIEVPLQLPSNQDEDSPPASYLEDINDFIEIGNQSVQTQTHEDNLKQIGTSSIQTQTHGHFITNINMAHYHQKCFYFLSCKGISLL